MGVCNMCVLIYCGMPGKSGLHVLSFIQTPQGLWVWISSTTPEFPFPCTASTASPRDKSWVETTVQDSLVVIVVRSIHINIVSDAMVYMSSIHIASSKF